MELRVLKCHNCGAPVEVENGIDSYTCSRCGYSSVLDGQSDATVKAKVAVMEMEHRERILDKQFEQEQIRRKQHAQEETNNLIITKILPGIAIAILVIIFIATGISNDAKKIPIPASASSFARDNYLNAEKILRDAGFTNITMSELTEKAGLIGLEITGKPGDVKEITIDGSKDFKQGYKYYPDAQIVITYFSMQSVRDEATKKLEELRTEIENDLANAKFSDAKKKAEGLKYNATNEKDTIEYWDKIREDLILRIDEQANADHSIAVPESAKKYKGKNYQDVKTSLETAGFVNIRLEATPKKSGVLGILQKEGDVFEITINGLDEFKKGDKYQPGDVIVIKYYSAPEDKK